MCPSAFASVPLRDNAEGQLPSIAACGTCISAPYSAWSSSRTRPFRQRGEQEPQMRLCWWLPGRQRARKGDGDDRAAVCGGRDHQQGPLRARQRHRRALGGRLPQAHPLQGLQAHPPAPGAQHCLCIGSCALAQCITKRRLPAACLQLHVAPPLIRCHNPGCARLVSASVLHQSFPGKRGPNALMHEHE